MQLSNLDLIICGLYCCAIISFALWVSKEKEGKQKNSEDYFLAGKSLPWWAIGASLIAANISAEQIIGMSGSGYAIGLAIASYEWMAAITLIIIGKYFVPVYIKTGISTMPQFLERRYDGRVKIMLAVFWLAVYVFVNLTSVLYLGAMAIYTLTGMDIFWGLIFLAVLALAYSVYGGLKAIAITDIVQVVLLVFGGLCVSYIALQTIGGEQGVVQGALLLSERAPEKFDMILSKDNPYFKDLPGISVLIGGMWIMNLSYWGFNQYITQRTLAAKSVEEAQKGIVFAAFLKLLMPLIVVVPGIAAVVLAPELTKPDQAYPEMMGLLPSGLKGLTFAALIAAIVSSVGSMTNSIGTIFTMDIYSSIKKDTDESRLVLVGRVSAFVSLVIAVIVARPLLGNLDQAFQYIQEFTGFLTPGIVTLFVFGVFWRHATANGAIVAAVVSVLGSIVFKLYFGDIPFIDRVGIVFGLCCVTLVVVSKLSSESGELKAVDIRAISFKTSTAFNVAALSVSLILAVFYSVWW